MRHLVRDSPRSRNRNQPERLTRLYEELRMQIRYEPMEQAVYVAASPRVVNVRVRGRSCTLFTRPMLNQ